MTQQARAFDLVTMPIEGIAAYWLSLHRLVAGKKSFDGIIHEADAAAEPFSAYLLDIAFFSGFDDDEVLRLADKRARNYLGILKRRLELMRICILDINNGENPRRTYTRMAALFPVMPVSAGDAMETAQSLLKSIAPKGKAPRDGEPELPSIPNVSHQQREEELIAHLLFYVLLARRHSKMAVRPLLQGVGSRFFADGAMLSIDGFDDAFVRRWLKAHKEALLEDARRKMELSALMAQAVRGRKDYNDAYRIARAFLR